MRRLGAISSKCVYFIDNPFKVVVFINIFRRKSSHLLEIQFCTPYVEFCKKKNRNTRVLYGFWFSDIRNGFRCYGVCFRMKMYVFIEKSGLFWVKKHIVPGQVAAEKMNEKSAEICGNLGSPFWTKFERKTEKTCYLRRKHQNNLIGRK